MNDQDDPNLVTSGKSQRVVVDGYACVLRERYGDRKWLHYVLRI